MSGSDKLSRSEIGKDAVQSTVEAAADTVGQVAKIITQAVQDVAGAVGGFATEVYEIRDASRKAVEDTDPDADVADAVDAASPDEPGTPSVPAPSAEDVDPRESS